MSTAVGMKVLAVLIGLQLGLGISVVALDGTPETERRARDSLAESFGEIEGSGAESPPPDGSPPPVPDPGSAAAPGAAAVPPAAVTGEIPAPRAGTYRYTQTVRTRSEESSTTANDEKTEEIARRIERVSESASEIVDRRHTPSRVIATGDDGSKSESASYEERSWRPDGSFLRTEVSEFTETRQDGTQDTRRSECNWEPDRLQLVFPLRVGLEWSWDSSCTTTTSQGDVTTTNNGRARVVGTRDLDIGGRSVPTFIIELSATEDSSGDLGEQRGARFERHATQRTTSFFAPSLGLPARIEAEQKEDATITGPPGSGEPHRSSSTQTSTSELLSVDPT